MLHLHRGPVNVNFTGLCLWILGEVSPWALEDKFGLLFWFTQEKFTAWESSICFLILCSPDDHGS